MKNKFIKGFGVVCAGLLTHGVVHANAAALSFSQDASVVSTENAAFTGFSGSSSAVFSVGEKRQRIGTTDSQLIGAVRESSIATPFGNADLLQATYGRADYPFQYTLKIKRLEDINAFTVQAVIHNRSDEAIRLHNFDLFDMRKGMRGALSVENPSDWLVTPLMEDSTAMTYDVAEKRLNESALFKNPQGEGFLVGPVGPADAYTNVQFINQEFLASVAMDNVLVPAGESRRSEEMIFLLRANRNRDKHLDTLGGSHTRRTPTPWPSLRLVQLV